MRVAETVSNGADNHARNHTPQWVCAVGPFFGRRPRRIYLFWHLRDTYILVGPAELRTHRDTLNERVHPPHTPAPLAVTVPPVPPCTL